MSYKKYFTLIIRYKIIRFFMKCVHNRTMQNKKNIVSSQLKPIHCYIIILMKSEIVWGIMKPCNNYVEESIQVKI